MALNDDTTDRPISGKNGGYETAKDIELENYMRTIFDLSRQDPDILYRVLELEKEKRKGENHEK